METLYDRELSELEGLEMCESCAWAIWDNGDWSVGLYPGVENCKAPLSLKWKYEFAEVPKKWCPWYSKKFPTENDRNRCNGCNSPKFKVLYNLQMHPLHWTPNILIRCLHCGKLRIIDDVALDFVVNE